MWAHQPAMPAAAKARSRSRSHAAARAHPKHGTPLDSKCIATIRCLSAEQPTAAKSGHPGAALGCAPIAHALWGRLMRFSPKDPKWLNRDRFVLSNGHACALQYSMLHLTGYDLSLEDLQKFRHLHSKCPGHPESFMTPGVEVVTGPLAQGVSNAVGMALARAHMAARFNRPGFTLFDNSVFAICGDGCMMEGLTSEACSIAGELSLPGLVIAYDDNNITIDGSTDLAFTEDVGERYQAYGWDVSTIEEGDTDFEGIVRGLRRGREVERPVLLKVKTTIGYGSVKANTAHVHGTPLTAEDLQQLRKASGFPEDEKFHVPKRAGEYYRSRGKEGDEAAEHWRDLLKRYGEAYPAEHAELVRRQSGQTPPTWWGCLEGCTKGPVEEGDAVLAALIAEIPELVGGSVAESPPLATAPPPLTAENRAGRHVDFGEGREHAAAAICVGLASYGAVSPYWRCPLALLPNAWGAIRLTALGLFGVIHIATYDGSDAGEVLALCRATPNLALVRPADAAEVAGAYAAALASRTRPTVVVLPPPGSERLPGSSAKDTAKGGYTLADFPEGVAQRAILVSSGPEVAIGLAAQGLLAKQGVGIRVVSLPSWELFEEQTEEYQHAVLERARTRHAAKHKPADRHVPVFYADEASAEPLGFERYAAEGRLAAGDDEGQPLGSGLASRLLAVLHEAGH